MNIQNFIIRLSELPLWKPRYPLVRQFDRADCGPAALLTVLRIFGGNTTLTHVRQLCGTTLSGSSMHDLVLAAQTLGLQAHGAMGEYEDLARERMPCIAYVEAGPTGAHFVVLYKIDSSGVLLGDPGRGILRMSQEEFLALWTSKIVLLFDTTGQPFTTPTRSALAWMLSHLAGTEPWMMQMIFLGLLATGLGLLAASSVQLILDTLIPAGNIPDIVRLALILGIVVLLKAGLGFFRQKFIIVLSRRVTERVAGEFLDHIFHLPKDFFATRQTGDITSRIGDAAKVQQAVIRVLAAGFLDLFILVGSLALLAFFSSTLFWCTLGIIPLFALLVARSAREISIKNHAALGAYAQVESAYIDALTGIDEILNHSSGPAFARATKQRFSQFQESIVDLGLLQAKLSFLGETSSNLLSFVILTVGAGLVISGTLLIGKMMAAFSLAAFAFPSVMRLVEAGVNFNSASVAFRRLMDILEVPGEECRGTRPFTLAEGLTMREGTFGWSRRTQLFSDVSFTVAKGTLTALWGPSGSGKSTLADILVRKLSLASGALLVDDVPAGEFDLAEYRRKVAVVSQDAKLFHGTIVENVYLGREVRETESLQAVLADIGLEHFFDRFDHGLATVVGEKGQRMSGGERQVIALLRALVNAPDLLIVDEALSGLDFALEGKILEFLRRFSRTHGVLIITHDLERIREADVAYLLSAGRMSTAMSSEDAIARMMAGSPSVTTDLHHPPWT